MMHLFSNPVIGYFIERPNRFIIVSRLKTGELVRAHAPNPGRMWELLYPPSQGNLVSDRSGASYPGTELLLESAVDGRNGGLLRPSHVDPSRAGRSPRRTAWTVVAVVRPSDGTLIPLVPTGANRIAAELIIPGLFGSATIRPEVTIGRSRFDFVIGDDEGEKTTIVEVKSCTLEAQGVAMFPDAATARGRRHIEELTELQGWKRLVLFVVQGPQPNRFVPDIHTDPEFARAFRRAKEEGVDIRVVATKTDQEGTTSITDWDVPIDWGPIAAVDRNSGSYIVDLRLDTEKTVGIGSLGSQILAAGHYLYVGSAMGMMKERTDRHRRKRKRMRWHIDYLRSVADGVSIYPIYSTQRLECRIANAMTQLFPQPIARFGASDCACESHLFYVDGDPTDRPEFIEALLAFRHDLALRRDLTPECDPTPRKNPPTSRDKIH